MNCYLHPDREASAYCRSCGRALCSEDQRSIYGVIYCQDCLARQMGMAPPAPPAAAMPEGSYTAPLPPPPVSPVTNVPPGAPSPGVALALGFIPGVGAIYCGQYLKALIEVIVFGTLVALSHGPYGDLFGWLAAAMYFYMVIDSYRTARAMCLGQPVEDFPGLGHVQVKGPVVAVVLIALGGLLLLRTMGILDYNGARFIWPIVLIGFGIFLLQRQQRRA
jgi:hypothetical protein